MFASEEGYTDIVNILLNLPDIDINIQYNEVSIQKFDDIAVFCC